MIFFKLKKDVQAKAREKNPVFPADDQWKQSHYVLLSEIINEELHSSELLKGEKLYELGKTISPMTLKRFFEGKYNDGTVTDLRFLKSVDKLAIFLGYENFATYHAGNLITTAKDSPLKGDGFFTDLVKKYCEAEFNVYKSLPDFEFSALDEILFTECPLRARFTVFIKMCNDKKFILVQDGHRSNYEVYDIKVLNKTDTECICETTEFWNLLFKSLDSGESYTHYYSSRQSYFFKKEKDVWRLWDNYNPGSGKLDRQAEHKPLQLK